MNPKTCHLSQASGLDIF